MPEGMGWAPLITFWQTGVDAMNAMVTVPGEFGSFGHDYRADTARFVRDAYHLPAVTDHQMGRIEAELRTLELQRADRIKASHLDAAPPAPAQRKDGEREVGASRYASAGRWRQVVRDCYASQQGTRRHPIAGRLSRPFRCGTVACFAAGVGPRQARRPPASLAGGRLAIGLGATPARRCLIPG